MAGAFIAPSPVWLLPRLALHVPSRFYSQSFPPRPYRQDCASLRLPLSAVSISVSEYPRQIDAFDKLIKKRTRKETGPLLVPG
jgi:hypothetical protein